MIIYSATPDLIYLEPRLSGLAGDQQMYYYTCKKDIANDVVTVER